MRNKKDSSKNSNIVEFPNLAKKLTDKGMKALQNKQINDAIAYFAQLIELEPEHPQGHYGTVLCFIELERFNEAEKWCENMLEDDIGDYYEVMKVYMLVLVQQGKFEKVITVLESVLEAPHPSKAAAVFEQTLHLAQEAINNEEKEEIIEIEDDELQLLIKELDNAVPEKQLHAIEMLSRIDNSKIIDAYKTFLKDEQKDPFLKSMILQSLREKNIDEAILIHKCNKKMTVYPNKLQDVFKDEYVLPVKQLLNEHIEHQNPTLYGLNLQIWLHYLYAIYPLVPSDHNANVWAGALHKVGAFFNGIEIEVEELAACYKVEKSSLLDAERQLLEIERNTFQGREFRHQN
ncbi:tetratricopeptide repeat protein [Bacillus taeanensis]|uniref:Uncharacterized protein n=1 Tax=Bacillus taeanensis TaxID=273032 RepID=A0A366Y2F8_9BACI|nr:tetratricopeptide repeat protein [Bacillus taeanensis]RBW71565.1 hypothetical protein DS031_02110 [Bacillus taeanensis]